MKIIYSFLAIFLVLVLCPSCNKDIKNLQEEMKVLKDENNFYKAENIALKKELEELYKKIEERDLAKQKSEQKINEAGLDRAETIKKQDKTEPERPKLPVSGKTGR